MQDAEAFTREYHVAVTPESVSVPKAKKAKKPIADDDDDDADAQGDDAFTTVGKGGKAMQFTPETIFKNLQLVQEARGKKVRCQRAAVYLSS